MGSSSLMLFIFGKILRRNPFVEKIDFRKLSRRELA